MKQIRHKLPTDPGPDDATWFARQNDFEQAVIKQQVQYRRSCWPNLPNGPFSKQPQHTYPHILPPAEMLAFFDGFAAEVIVHMKENDIAIHTEALNLKSSQVACINFLFPLARDPELAARVLPSIIPDLNTVQRIEFEYTGQDEKDRKHQPCTAWLNEPKSGKRGQNRTSIDAAIFWTDHAGESHATLIEWKYTEKNFGTCSAYQGLKKRKLEQPCHQLDVLGDPASRCDLAQPGRHRNRRYWQHMADAGISLDRLANVGGCPFRGPFYQLMRQFLVAQFLRHNDDPLHSARHVDVIALEFEGNTALQEIPEELARLKTSTAATVIDAWNAVLDGVPPLRSVTAEQLIAGYDADDVVDVVDATWREYIRARYAL